MLDGARKWAMFLLRWGVAVVGIWWVLANMSLRDKVTILDQRLMPVDVELARPAAENSASFVILDLITHRPREVPRMDTVNRPDKKNLRIDVRSEKQKSLVLALDLSDDLKRVRRILIQDPATSQGRWIPPWEAPDYRLQVPHPRVEVGVLSLARDASPLWLWLSVLIMPATFIITSIRWHALLKALDIHLTLARTFVINMVGAFYNTIFMLGSTGGDVLKAYYASKQTTHRTRAVISVFVDRVLGLLSLVVMGGTMAAIGYFNAPDKADPAARACLRVACGAVAILTATLAGVLLFREPVRRRLGLDYLLKRLPMQKHVQHLVQSMSMYRRRPGLMLGSIVFTFPVHIAVVFSSMFAGWAFGLKMPAMYYFVVVPVVVLSGAVPISPQGAGVQEFFAIQLTKQHGITVSQAFALTMSIRMVQIIWNLSGGFFVLRGGYHAPTETEKKELEEDDAAELNDEIRMTNDESITNAQMTNDQTEA